jgi:hypothetical protein
MECKIKYTEQVNVTICNKKNNIIAFSAFVQITRTTPLSIAYIFE